MLPTHSDHFADIQKSRGFRLLIGASLVLLLLRLPLLHLPSLWIDEAFSLYHARLSLTQLWGEGWRLESSPPLYYSVLWAWLRLVADSEPSARMLSLMLTAIAAVFVFRAGRVLAGPLAGAAAVFVWLLPALGLEFSLEIRPYALQQLWIAVAIWSFVSLVSPLSADGSGNQQGASLRMAVYLLLASVATFYTHTTSLAFLGGLASAGLYVGFARRLGWRYWRGYAALVVAAVLLSVPQVIAAAGVLASNRAGLAWIPSALDAGVVLQVVRQWTLGMQWWSLKISGTLTAIVLSVLMACVWWQRSRVEQVALGLIMTGVGATLLVVAGVIQSVLLPRTALWLWLPMALVTGSAVASINWRMGVWKRLLAAVFVALLVGCCLLYVRARPAERPWYNTLQALEARVQPGERLVFIDPEIACVLDQYAGKKLASLPRVRLDLGRVQRFRSGQRLNIVCNQMPVIAPSDVAAQGVLADWIFNDGVQQRSDLNNLLQRDNTTLKSTESVRRIGQAQATRVVRVNPP